MGDDKQLQASAKADISAVLKGPERGLLVLGVIFLLVFALSLTAGGTLLGYAGGGVSLLGLVALLARWLMSARDAYSHDQPLTTIQTPSVTVTAQVSDPSERLTMLREVLQNRGPIPEPHGAVVGNASDPGALRAYTPAEKDTVVNELTEAAKRHDRTVIEQLMQAEKQLRLNAGAASKQEALRPKGGIINEPPNAHPDQPPSASTNRLAGRD